MCRTKKPAAPGRARASETVSVGRRDNQKSTHFPRKNQSPGEVAIYDSLAFIGHLVPKGKGWLAYNSSGKFLGGFASDRLGATAVYQAHRPGGAG